VTALFGHAGIEWDITTASADERAQLARWTQYYRDHRGLLHGGRVVRADDIDDAAILHGVVAHDGSEAIYAYAQVATPMASRPDQLLLPGLDPNAEFDIRIVHLAGPPRLVNGDWPEWGEGIRLPGSVLANAGLRPPRMFPETAFLIEVTRVRA
jgi:alpha-galactosidase